MIPTWTIWLDGAAYSGETAQQEHAVPTAGRGWTGKQTETRNCIRIGGPPLEIQGKTNLRSHLTRIMDRLGDTIEANEITLRRCQ
jgi:hypothetical protein